ncbi:MAG: hypothetical protein KUG59_05370 [Parvibaculaceae bacterium]|nr:hypothetical protein [Parvibaculaceae bacterium]
MEYLKISSAALVKHAAFIVQLFVSLCAFCRVRFFRRIFAVSGFAIFNASVAAGLGFGLTIGLWGHSVSEAVWAHQWSPPVPAAGLLFASLDDEAFARNQLGDLPPPVSAVGISLFDRGEEGVSVRGNRMPTSYFLARRTRFIIRGEITPSLAAYVETLPDSRLKLVELDSVGGDVVAAISIARRIRSVGGHTYVGSRGKCFSSCGVIFLGGVRRVAASNALFLLHYAKQESSDPQFALESSIWGTVALIETMIDLGADPALYDQIPGLGDWLLTAHQAESIGIVQYVETLR